ncbi:MAG TPA: DEAD/DEAH box helicase [Pirellulales bacterium]|nr:DEAD/DEAH box helicase [Pirellulales bacterium]
MPPVTPSLSFAGGTLLLKDLPAAGVRRVFGDLPWTWDDRTAAWRIDAIEYPAVRSAIDARRLACHDTVPKWQPVRWSKIELPPLRAEQQAALAAWQTGRRGLVVMPTGTGKTEVALSIVRDLAVSTLVVAPVRDLMYQWHRRIAERLGYEAGIVGDGVYRVSPVSVTTYDSAFIHTERLGDRFGLIVFDECHHLLGTLRRDAARMSAAPWRLGLTATPERSDGRHADYARLIGPVAYSLPLAAVRGSTLANYEVVRIPVFLAREEQARYDALARQVRQYVCQRRQTQPDFGWAELCADTGKSPEARRALRAYRAKLAIEDRAEEKLRVLEDLFRLHAGSRTIVFTGSNAMAREVSRRFLIPCLLSHCGKKERLEVLRGVEDGTYPALVANQVLDEGVDLPAAKVAVILGGKGSARQAKQRLGRILRKAGNERATLYEVVCTGTNEEDRSRRRRRNDAYQGTRHRRI